MAAGVAPGALTAQKADTLDLNNGDRIIGEVKVLENGLLEYKTDNIGTIKVKWDRVVQLTSRLYFEVETRGGVRYFGTLPRSDSVGYLAVALDQVMVIPLAEIVVIQRIKQSYFWDRIDGYLDLGFSYAKSHKTLQLTSGVEATYLTNNWAVSLVGDLFIQRQDQADPTRRWSVQPKGQLQLPNRWLTYLQVQLQQNQELGLDLRTLFSPGGGRELVRSNSHVATAFLGLAASKEWYADSTVASGQRLTTNLEGSVSASYQAFRYDSPELDFSVTGQLFPSISDPGRFRAEGDSRVRYEVLTDFYITLSARLSADTRPPNPDTPKSDFTTTLSISWKY